MTTTHAPRTAHHAARRPQAPKPPKALGPSRRSPTVQLDAQAEAFGEMTQRVRLENDFAILRCVTPTGKWMHISEVLGSKWVNKNLSQFFLDYVKTGERALREMRNQFPQFMGDQLQDQALLKVISGLFSQTFLVEQPAGYQSAQLLLVVEETTIVLGDWAGWRARTAPKQPKVA